MKLILNNAIVNLLGVVRSTQNLFTMLMLPQNY